MFKGGEPHMSKEKKRVTTHRGRVTKSNQAYSVKHNDRAFDVSSADHIHQEKSDQNIYWHWCQEKHPHFTFEEAEKLFYEEHFSEGLKHKNARYIKSGHKERCKSIDEYRLGSKTCPEEQLLYIGKKGQDVPRNALWNAFAKYVKWHRKTFPQVKFLDAALHVDEDGQIHIHERHTYVAKDKYGFDAALQKQALKAMGIERPDTSKPEGRYNNAKMTYTSMCREKFIEIAKDMGFEIEVEVKEKSKTGLNLLEYQYQETQEKFDVLSEELGQLKHYSLLERLHDFVQEKYPHVLSAFYKDEQVHQENLRKIFGKKHSSLTGIKKKNLDLTNLTK